MLRMKRAFLILAITLMSQTVYSQTQLRDWVGKYPTNRHTRRFANIFKVSPLNGRLRHLLGRNYYRRITFNDNFVETPILLVDNYIIVMTCEAHNCVSKQMFLAVNLDRADIHVALYHYGSLDWFHTAGKSADLPASVLAKLDDRLPRPLATFAK